MVAPKPKKPSNKTVLVEIPVEDARVWAEFRLKIDTRHKRLGDACARALAEMV
jgi:hypothetical protein